MKRAIPLGLLGVLVLAGISSCAGDSTVRGDLGGWQEGGGPTPDRGGPTPDRGGPTPDTGVEEDTGVSTPDTGGAQDTQTPEEAGGLKENWYLCTEDADCVSGVCGYNMGCLNDENNQPVDSSLGKRCLPDERYPRENSSDGKCHH